MSNTPTFNIFRADGSKVPGLKKSFIIKRTISTKETSIGWITLEDGTKWQLILELPVLDQLLYGVFCIISMQVYEHGNFAVARKYESEPTISKEQEAHHD